MSRHQPNRHTCPDIDKCIKWIKDAQSSIEYAIKQIDEIESNLDEENLDRAHGFILNAKDELNNAYRTIDFDGVLEELRNSNSELRDWGYNLREELEKMELYT